MYRFGTSTYDLFRVLTMVHSRHRGKDEASIGFSFRKLLILLWIVLAPPRSHGVCSFSTIPRGIKGRPGFYKPDENQHRTRLLLSTEAEKKGDRDMGSENGRAYLEEADFESNPNRRDFLSLGSALTTALSLFGVPEQASSALDPMNSGATLESSYNPDIPYSSVRRYKSITLANNGLKVLLVSDKLAFRAQCALTVPVGQFCDPDDLPGLAHLMEHMILSYNSKSTFRPNRDFEDWLGDQEGASNAFTANQRTCFHFSCPKTVLPEALERFAGLFLQEDVESVCRDSDMLAREIRRVDAELDFSNLYAQVEYIAKAFVNLEHPYSRFSKGSLESLERVPNKMGIDVGSRLIQFFRQYYLPTQAILVVIGPHEVTRLERWIAPFGFTLSRNKKREIVKSFFPGQFLLGSRYKQVILYRNSEESASHTEKLIFEWVMHQDYRDMMRGGRQTVTAPQIAFVIAQILGRRGPGSLYSFLRRRGWIPDGSLSVPRILLPVDASGFQILKLEINLTLEGFRNRSNIVSALYESIESVRSGDSFVISREIIAQYATISKLFGYVLAPRPPDAIELAFDAQVYGIDAVGSGNWYRFPNAEDLSGLGLNFLRREVSSTLSMMSDPENALIIATAGDNAITISNTGLINDPALALSSPKWITEPISGARIYFEDMLQRKSRVEQLVLSKIVSRDELLPPIFNSLVPTALRRARDASFVSISSNEVIKSNGVAARNFNGWTLLELTTGQSGLPLPRSSPEPSCRCCFVLELLSSRPARADVRQAARAELWKLLFDLTVNDLAELGAPGGLAYDISFNKYGLRLSFLGVSQTLPSYARRMTRRLVQHQTILLNGLAIIPTAITSAALSTASKAPGLSPARRRRIMSNLRSSTAYEVAAEGQAFLRSCSSAVCFAEGDLLESESIQLLNDLRDILQSSLNNDYLPQQASAATPFLDDLIYKPVWKPRYASACSIPGVLLMSDACGRIPR